QITAAAPWNDVVLAYRNGAPIRVRDIGRAVDAPENAKLGAWMNGKRGVALVVYKQPGANVIDPADRIKSAMPRLVGAVPPSMHIDVISDRTQTIRASVVDVQKTLAISVRLVVMVIFLFLRDAWATAMPAIAVPVSLVATLAAMYLLG